MTFVYGAISKIRSTKIVVVMSDENALFFFLVMLVAVPLLFLSLW